MKLKIKKLNEKAQIPFYSKEGDAGVDLIATTVDKSNNLFWEYGTDLCLEN